jgi:hypothetical protein
VAGSFQVRGPWQHVLEDRLTAVGELTDHRDVALGTPDDRVADRGPVAGVSVPVQEQVEPPVPVSAENARSSSRRDGLAVSQSTKPARAPPAHTAFHGDASRNVLSSRRLRMSDSGRE